MPLNVEWRNGVSGAELFCEAVERYRYRFDPFLAVGPNLDFVPYFYKL
jgi:hypothetical protein